MGWRMERRDRSRDSIVVDAYVPETMGSCTLAKEEVLVRESDPSDSLLTAGAGREMVYG